MSSSDIKPAVTATSPIVYPKEIQDGEKQDTGPR